MIGNLWLVPGLFAFLFTAAAAKDWFSVAEGGEVRRAANTTWLALASLATTMGLWAVGQFYG